MQPAALWEAVHAKGRFGAKAGAGFYLYGDRVGQPDTEMDEIVKSLKAQSKPTSGFSTNRVVLPMINEVIRCLEEHVCTAADADLAVVAGLGFPLSKGGILHYADEMGLETVLAELQRLAKEFGGRFWPSPLLKRKVSAGHLGKKTRKGFFEYAE